MFNIRIHEWYDWIEVWIYVNVINEWIGMNVDGMFKYGIVKEIN